MPQASKGSSLPRRPRTTCCWRALPMAAEARCTSFIHGTICGFTGLSFASCATPPWLRTSQARSSWTCGAPPGNSNVAHRFAPGYCRSRASRRSPHCVSAGMRTSTRSTCLKSPTSPTRPRPRWSAIRPVPFCAPALQSYRRRTARSSTSSTITRSRLKRSARSSASRRAR